MRGARVVSPRGLFSFPGRVAEQLDRDAQQGWQHPLNLTGHPNAANPLETCIFMPNGAHDESPPKGARRHMLTKEDNEILTRVGPGTLMGNLLRRY